MSGDVAKPGVYECDLGIPLSKLVNDYCGGMRGGKQYKGAIAGGVSTGVLGPDEYEAEMDFDKGYRVNLDGSYHLLEAIRDLRDRLWDRLSGALDGLHRNGHPERRLPGNLNVGFEGVEAEALLLALEGVALSSGSACSSASPEPSHVLRAMGVPPTLAHGSIRFGVGRGNTEAEIDAVAARLAPSELGDAARLEDIAIRGRETPVTLYRLA